MLTCKQASYLASKKLDGKLTWYENTGLWLHLAMCSLCRRYNRDVKKLQVLMRKSSKTGQALWPETVKLSELSRARIKQALNKALHQTK
jgi:predicted anti-sigma-YlaC factor YlaD